jgi:hypothetical protein
MKSLALITCAFLAATPAIAQKTNEQATEEGRQKNTQYVNDSTLTTKVHTALANDVGMSTLRSINVDSDKGTVTLKGVVDSEATKQRAGNTRRRLERQRARPEPRGDRVLPEQVGRDQARGARGNGQAALPSGRRRARRQRATGPRLRPGTW